MQNVEQLKKEIKEIISRITEISINDIGDHENLIDDLGIESIMIADILTEIEDAYQIEIPEETYERINCLEALVTVVEEIRAEKTHAS